MGEGNRESDMTDYDINDDDMPTFSPRDVMRRLADLEADNIRLWDYLRAPTPPSSPALDEAHEPPHGIRTEAAQQYSDDHEWIVEAIWNAVSESPYNRNEGTVHRDLLYLSAEDILARHRVAAPADRAVCEEAAQRERDRIVQAIRDYTSAENWRVVANWIASGANAHKDAAAHWRGAEAGKGRQDG